VVGDCRIVTIASLFFDKIDLLLRGVVGLVFIRDSDFYFKFKLIFLKVAGSIN